MVLTGRNGIFNKLLPFSIVVFIITLSSIYSSCKRGGSDPPPSIPPEPSTPTSSAPTFSQVYSILSGAGCLTSSCHGAASGPNNPVMNTQANAHTNLVGKTSSCSGKVYVVSGNSSSSYLIEKLSGSPACGSRMPQGNLTFFDTNASQLQTIRDWIGDGAKNN